MANALEDLLEKAVSQEQFRDAFCEMFFSENVFVPVISNLPEGAAAFSAPGQEPFGWAAANIQGYPTIAAFTSKENLDAFFAAMEGWENRFIEVSGKDLLTNMQASEGLSVAINPMSKIGVTFFYNQIPDMLAQYGKAA